MLEISGRVKTYVASMNRAGLSRYARLACFKELWRGQLWDVVNEDDMRLFHTIYNSHRYAQVEDTGMIIMMRQQQIARQQVWNVEYGGSTSVKQCVHSHM